MTKKIFPSWIAVDWGTSNLRLWAMDDTANILGSAESPLGMNAIAGDPKLSFEAVLIDLIEDWLGAAPAKLPVVICGMAGAKQGWLEAPYCDVPARPSDLAKGAVTPNVTDPRISVFILPGLCQRADPDVMRGEETQLVGFMAQNPDFAGWVCLPGTHSKWAHVSTGMIRGFRTYMSGEVFALLFQHSILRHSVDDTWDDASFADAVRKASEQPTAFLHSLFGVRAGALVAPVGASVAPGASVLSGTVIGAEIADVLGLLQPGENIALIGAGKLASLYQAALAVHGYRAALQDGAAITLSGLRQAHDTLISPPQET
ncbi:2-dehydro-3-deoxygalactonokinase [Thalassospira indica]|uniref:2-dehydro-3-deoxygalactonokinase n=1 Tax=Thalassospira indica TaxID=1891279 RepID=A0ABM6Y0Q6_9PROT|nr:2-dehydro-3-deoxygalactonokinase [Thalassospira indica]AXO15535.1 2-dehydro-3-deoxygalactonokinase [Thalassospira indica]OAZ08924.1 2-keto-3-deoxy-galactonokinase [Thalassospira profundimaris]